MALPNLVGRGAGAASDGTTSIDVAYPTVAIAPASTPLVAGDLILAHVILRTSGSTINTPSGWSKLVEENTGTNHIAAIFAKIASGSESGSVTFTVSGGGTLTNVKLGRMYSIRGHAGASPVSANRESPGVRRDTGGGGLIAPVVTTGDDRLGLAFLSAGDTTDPNTFSGGWAEPFAQFSSELGIDGTVGIATRDIATAGTVGEATFIWTPGDTWLVLSMAIIPASVAHAQVVMVT